MFRITLLGTISLVLLLAAASIASANGVGYTNYDSGHAVNATAHLGWMYTGGTTTNGNAETMPSSVATMANHIENASVQMREHAAQMEAANHMQATGMDPGYGMQSGNMETGTGYMDTNNMEYGSGYMDSGNTGTMGSSTGSGSHMGTTGTGGTGTTQTSGSGSMMGR